MANRIKKITIGAFENAVNKTYEPYTSIEWNGLTVVVKRHLSLAEVTQFVNACIAACFDDSGVSYSPAAKDVAIRGCIVALYSNVSMPSDIERQYDLIYKSGIVDIITKYIDNAQLTAIVDAIDDGVSHIAESNIGFINRQMENFYASLDDLQNKMSELFNGLSASDINNVVRSISENGIDEKKLVEAYIEAGNGAGN